VTLLQDFHRRAFEENDATYYGEVAGKLRLLVYRSKTCHPLLRDLMDKLGIHVRMNLIGPGHRSADIDEYFGSICGMFHSQRTGKKIELTPMDVVSSWAHQIGASHEDPAIDEDFAEFLSHDFFVRNRQIAVDELRRASKFVLAVAKFFFHYYEKRKTE
jgi:hypothetical protein